MIKHKISIVKMCLCIYIILIVGLYLLSYFFTTPVDRINTKNYSIFENGCVFVFMCFCISTLFHFTTSVDKTNN